MKNMQEALAYINDKWNKAQKEGKLSFKITIDNGRKYTVKHYDTFFGFHG